MPPRLWKRPFRRVEEIGGALWFLPLLFAADVAFVLVSWAAAQTPARLAEWVRMAGVLALFVVGCSNQQFVMLLPRNNSAMVAILLI